MSEKKLQIKELENVAGGGIDDEYGFIDDGVITKCENCKNEFYRKNVESQSVGSGCSKFWIYKCPNCPAWVRSNGDVYKMG